MVSGALRSSGIERIVVIYPNNDPGAGGIIRHWQSLKNDRRFIIRRDVPRPTFLGLLRDAALLVGNSSSGIIEAASFRTPVVDIGPRQLGRERCEDVRNVPYRQSSIASAIGWVWNAGRPISGQMREYLRFRRCRGEDRPNAGADEDRPSTVAKDH